MLTWFLATLVFAALLGGGLVVYTEWVRRRGRSARAGSEAEVEYEARDELVPQLEETLSSYTFRPQEALQTATGATVASVPATVASVPATVASVPTVTDRPIDLRAAVPSSVGASETNQP